MHEADKCKEVIVREVTSEVVPPSQQVHLMRALHITIGYLNNIHVLSGVSLFPSAKMKYLSSGVSPKCYTPRHIIKIECFLGFTHECLPGSVISTVKITLINLNAFPFHRFFWIGNQ